MAPLDREEFARWFSQARHTLASAARDLEGGDYDWASFKAHQGAEYALKGLLRGLGRPAFGHALLRLVQALREAGVGVPGEVEEAAKGLDLHYIPARYPDAYPEGSPHEYYTEGRAREALAAAQKVLAWVEEVWRGLGGA
ncbi:DNA-binding protein [Thermus composti]|uniref:HEPN domain-containing protein n=1 Tax=Thermus composti TaxID=532059 RepID=A0ABV6Q4P0_9DEIN|nr:HEPN domain-containing protein [Thermus composti]GGM98361.1 DNA-binding protein [Thermus composti]